MYDSDFFDSYSTFRGTGFSVRSSEAGPRAKLLATSALTGLMVFCVSAAGPQPAQAQFVCERTAATGGGGANANADDSAFNIACGPDANASGSGSLNTAMGSVADASGVDSENTAIGNLSIASGGSSANVAIGTGANASGDGTQNTAVGTTSEATGANASAFGSGASATHANSAAFGQNATTARDNQQVFGTASNTYTLPGVTTEASRAAQGTATQLVTSNGVGDLATRPISELGIAAVEDLSALENKTNANTAAIQQNTASIQGNSGRIDEAFEGAALGLAMAGTFLPQPGESVRLSGNWGNFEGSNAVAFSGAMALGTQTFVTAGVGVGLEEDTVGGRAGVSYGW